MSALKKIVPHCEFAGIGGPAMVKQGLHSLESLQNMSVVGFVEVARRYSFFRNTLQRAAAHMRSWKADLFVAVDYPGFNTRLAEEAKKAGIPVVWYIAPQFWAWGQSRARNFSRVVDKLLVVFPFEVEFFQQFGIETEFVGHPLLDDPEFQQSIPPLEGRIHQLALLPGSRRQELKRHLPLFSDVVHEMKNRFPLLKCSVAQGSQFDANAYADFGRAGREFDLNTNARQLMKQSAIGLIKTGTSTLEAALCGLPFCMVYKTSNVSYWIGRSLVKLPHISLVNILAGRELVREFIQSDATPTSIADELSRLLSDSGAAAALHRDLLELRKSLGEAGAADRAAARIAGLSKHSSQL